MGTYSDSFSKMHEQLAQNPIKSFREKNFRPPIQQQPQLELILKWWTCPVRLRYDMAQSPGCPTLSRTKQPPASPTSSRRSHAVCLLIRPWYHLRQNKCKKCKCQLSKSSYSLSNSFSDELLSSPPLLQHLRLQRGSDELIIFVPLVLARRVISFMGEFGRGGAQTGYLTLQGAPAEIYGLGELVLRSILHIIAVSPRPYFLQGTVARRHLLSSRSHSHPVYS